MNNMKNQFVIGNAYAELPEDRARILASLSEKAKTVLSAEYPTQKSALDALKVAGMWGQAWIVNDRSIFPKAMPYIRPEASNLGSCR